MFSKIKFDVQTCLMFKKKFSDYSSQIDNLINEVKTVMGDEVN